MEILIVVLLIVSVSLLVILLLKQNTGGLSNKISELDKKSFELEQLVRSEFNHNRAELGGGLKDVRLETGSNFKDFSDTFNKTLSGISLLQKNQLDIFSSQLINLSKTNEDKLEKVSLAVSSSISNLQQQINNDAIANRLELNTRLEKIDVTLEARLKSLQEDNNAKLEKMRETVDEKLHTTLEKKLGESFKLVSDRLELVHKGLGEMQTLASGVGDIKKVLMNIKTKGVLGEYQLENILEQLLTPQQYSRNVRTKKGSTNTVEFAVMLPGRDTGTLWLPVDSKFPTENYQQLLAAYEAGDPDLIIESKKLLVRKVRDCAKDIRDKYIDPPNTTDFAIMFLPFEGLFAEVLNNVGLFESTQRDLKIIITGPTTLSALLSSLQMGFRTLAIEKRSSEVWEILGSIKTEFGKFGDILDRTKKKLQEATNTIESAEVKTRSIERRLKEVQSEPVEELPLFGEEVK